MELYKGATLPVSMTLIDDDGNTIVDLSNYDIEIALSNKYDDVIIHKGKADMDIDIVTGIMTVQFDAAETNDLNEMAIFECKITDENGYVKIKKVAQFVVIDNKIKDL